MREVAIVGAGAMGSAVAARLVATGCAVLTILDGRSTASRDRAAAAGMTAVRTDRLVTAPILLSIVPPGQAEAVFDRLAPALAAAASPPLFVDCNALSPDSKRRLADQAAAIGVRLVDGAIIGGPPVAGTAGPRFHVSGPGADAVAALCDHGLRVSVLDGPVGTAAALKMCYAGINKGLTALTTAMLLAADRSGSGAALRTELADSLPWLWQRSRRSVPASYPKAYRWVAEMEEIAGFLGDDPIAAAIYADIARFFSDRAGGAADGAELERLKTILDTEGTEHDR